VLLIEALSMKLTKYVN